MPYIGCGVNEFRKYAGIVCDGSPRGVEWIGLTEAGKNMLRNYIELLSMYGRKFGIKVKDGVLDDCREDTRRLTFLHREHLEYTILEVITLCEKNLEELAEKKITEMCERFGIDIKEEQTMSNTATPAISNVIFNDPATIVIWGDGSKTVVKCQGKDKFDPEKGLAMAIAKKTLGDGYYGREFKKWLPAKPTEKSDAEIIDEFVEALCEDFEGTPFTLFTQRTTYGWVHVVAQQTDNGYYSGGSLYRDSFCAYKMRIDPQRYAKEVGCEMRSRLERINTFLDGLRYEASKYELSVYHHICVPAHNLSVSLDHKEVGPGAVLSWDFDELPSPEEVMDYARVKELIEKIGKVKDDEVKKSDIPVCNELTLFVLHNAFREEAKRLGYDRWIPPIRSSDGVIGLTINEDECGWYEIPADYIRSQTFGSLPRIAKKAAKYCSLICQFREIVRYEANESVSVVTRIDQRRKEVYVRFAKRFPHGIGVREYNVGYDDIVSMGGEKAFSAWASSHVDGWTPRDSLPGVEVDKFYSEVVRIMKEHYGDVRYYLIDNCDKECFELTICKDDSIEPDNCKVIASYRAVSNGFGPDDFVYIAIDTAKKKGFFKVTDPMNVGDMMMRSMRRSMLAAAFRNACRDAGLKAGCDIIFGKHWVSLTIDKMCLGYRDVFDQEIENMDFDDIRLYAEKIVRDGKVIRDFCIDVEVEASRFDIKAECTINRDKNCVEITFSRHGRSLSATKSFKEIHEMDSNGLFTMVNNWIHLDVKPYFE